jgi:putative DNA primase/helicase
MTALHLDEGTAEREAERARKATNGAATEADATIPLPPKPLPPALPPVPEFPLAAMPDTLRPWIADVTERIQCPVEFVALPMLVAAASIVARHVAIRPQAKTDWTERANLWGIVVGRPGAMKSPAVHEALRSVQALEAAAGEDFGAAKKKHELALAVAKLHAEAKVKEAKKRLAKNRDADVAELLAPGEGEAAPTCERFVVNDVTYEAGHAVMSENPGGVLLVRDELAGWLVHLSGEERAAARDFFNTAWSGGPYTFDRIKRGTIAVPDVNLSIIGGIQPGPLSEFIARARKGEHDVGLVERFIFAWPDDPGEWREVDRFPDNPARKAAHETFKRLAALSGEALGAEVETDPDGNPRAGGRPYLRLTEEARECFVEWRYGIEARLRSGEAGVSEAALSKFRHHVPALALTLHVAGGGAGRVNQDAMERALALAEVFEAHTARVTGSGRRAAVHGSKAILAKLRAGTLEDGFTARDVQRKGWTGLTERGAIGDALDLLVAHRWLVETVLPAGERGGRPSETYSLTEGARHGQVA